MAAPTLDSSSVCVSLNLLCLGPSKVCVLDTPLFCQFSTSLVWVFIDDADDKDTENYINPVKILLTLLYR